MEIMEKVSARENRQTMLLSATFNPEIKVLASQVLRPGYEFVDTIGDEGSTHKHVPQRVVFCKTANQITELIYWVKKAMNTPNYKVIVFFPTAMVTDLCANFFRAMNIPVICIHSRLPQSKRNNASKKFHSETNSIMFSSDLTARGMDYPDVTQVIQLGFPENPNQYVHRLGRTARIGKEGSGILILMDWEKCFLKHLSGMPLETFKEASDQEHALLVPDLKKAVPVISEKSWNGAYQSWLGYYRNKMTELGWKREKLVEMANYWINNACHQSQLPKLKVKSARMMGLIGVKGLTTYQ